MDKAVHGEWLLSNVVFFASVVDVVILERLYIIDI